MKGKMIFALQCALTLLALFVLFSVTSEEWDGACGHKREYGLFAFYRAGSNTGPVAECASGFLFSGLALTALSSGVFVFLSFWSWRKLIK